MAEWYEQPITAEQVVEAVDAWLRGAASDEDRAAFIEHNAERWRGITWSEATAWDLAAEWRRFIAERSKT